MKRIITILITLLSASSFAQDYVVQEKFNPKNYSRVITEINPNNRFIYGWGRNYNDGESGDLLVPKGSNFFEMRYQYNQPLFLGCHFVFGFGYNWDAYRLTNDSTTLYADSVFHKKRKLRFQNITTNLGFRFQTNEDPDDSWFFQASMYNDFMTHSAYVTWDEVGDMKHRTRLSKLDFVNKHNYGLEMRFGYGGFVLFSRYRMSDIIKSAEGRSEIPRVTYGIQIDISTSEEYY